MRHGFGVAMALLGVTLCSLLPVAAAADYDPQKEIVIPYGEFNGQAWNWSMMAISRPSP